jgi:RNA recognition motif-containing protein
MTTKLYIGNLSYSASDTQLRDAFAPYGAVLSATIITDRDTGQPRGFGFVEYATSDEASRAVEGMNGVDLAGRAVVVSVARPRTSDRDSQGGDRRLRGAGGRRRDERAGSGFKGR